MEEEMIVMPERAETDMFCEACNHEITEGEDCFYDQNTEEFYCEICAIRRGIASINYSS